MHIICYAYFYIHERPCGGKRSSVNNAMRLVYNRYQLLLFTVDLNGCLTRHPMCLRVFNTQKPSKCHGKYTGLEHIDFWIQVTFYMNFVGRIIMYKIHVSIKLVAKHKVTIQRCVRQCLGTHCPATSHCLRQQWLGFIKQFRFIRPHGFITLLWQTKKSNRHQIVIVMQM